MKYESPFKILRPLLCPSDSVWHERPNPIAIIIVDTPLNQYHTETAYARFQQKHVGLVIFLRWFPTPKKWPHSRRGTKEDLEVSKSDLGQDPWTQWPDEPIPTVCTPLWIFKGWSFTESWWFPSAMVGILQVLRMDAFMVFWAMVTKFCNKRTTGGPYKNESFVFGGWHFSPCLNSHGMSACHGWPLEGSGAKSRYSN